MYLGDLHRTANIPKYASPSEETDFSGLPPAYTFVGTIEPFYDETVRYFNNLRRAGVSAEVTIYEGCYHAFDQICPKADISQIAVKKMLEEFLYAAAHYFAKQPKMS
jgi:acetyl esterase/lipase